MNLKTIIKTMLLSIAIIIIGHVKTTAQTSSCCAISSTQAFAALGNDPSFGNAHLPPIPFHYESDKGKMITYKTSDGKTASAYEVKIEKASDKYLIVVHEFWGLNDYIKREAVSLHDELNDVNIIALDLYDGKVGTVADSAMKLMKALTDDRAKAIINGALAYAGKKAKIQTIGWCMGGSWSLQASLLAAKQLKGCVMYYGMPEKNVDKLKTLNAPVLGIFANKDKYINTDLVNQFEKDMKTAGKQLTLKRYDADHGFANPSNPKYEKTMADEAHGIAVAFIKTNFK